MKRIVGSCLFWLALLSVAFAGGFPLAPSAPTVNKQTLGAKLRNAYAAASGSNVEINTPWFACVSGNNTTANLVCSAWVASNAYVYGNVVSNSGHLYIETTASCTSAASGGPTQTTNVQTADNTCNWLYYGEPRTTANDAGAPSLSTASNTSPFSGAVYWNAQTYPNLYTLEGLSFLSNFASYFIKTKSFNNYSANSNSFGGRICANVTDSKFAVSVNGAYGYGISIDGRILSPQPDLYTNANPASTIFDFTGANGFKTRQVCLIGTKVSLAWGGIFTTASGSVTPAAAPLVSAAMLYDSYDAGSGYGPFSGYGVLGQQIAAYMGWSVFDMSQGGTGPQNTNAGTPTTAGSFTVGATYTIITIGTTNFTGIGATSNTVGLQFTATGAGSGNGTAGLTYYNFNSRVADAGNAAALATVNVIITNVSTNDAPCNSPIVATSLAANTEYTIVTIGTTDFTAIGASSNTVGLQFAATGAGTGTGTAVPASSCPIGLETVAIQNLLTALRAKNPTALLVIVGPAPVNNSSQYSAYVSEETAGSAAVAAWSDPAGVGMTCFVPWATSTTFSPVVASYQTGVPSGLPSTAFVINSSDSLHPTDLGTSAFASWISQQVAQLCLANVR